MEEQAGGGVEHHSEEELLEHGLFPGSLNG